MLSGDPTLMDGVDVARVLDTDPRNGLPLAEAALRLERVGPNRLKITPSLPAWRRLVAQFTDPLIYLLIGAVIVSLLAWASEGPHGPPIEAIVIAADRPRQWRARLCPGAPGRAGGGCPRTNGRPGGPRGPRRAGTADQRPNRLVPGDLARAA